MGGPKEDAIRELLLHLDFYETIMNGKTCYCYANTYYRVSFIKGFDAYVIEYAKNREDAEKGLFEDGDLYPLSLGNNLITTLKKIS